MGSIASAVGGTLNSVTGLIGLNQANNQQQLGYSNANGIINQYYPEARDTINTGYGLATNNINTGATNSLNSLNTGYNTGVGALNTNYGLGIKGFAPYQAAGATAANELNRLISSGYASHQFDTQDLYNGLSPNYDFQLNQGKK
jgi:hypothetical protein